MLRATKEWKRSILLFLYFSFSLITGYMID